jgi:hypothetical protein
MITGLLSWYDEDPGWLYESVSSALALCDRVVALDGAYALFPEGKPHSPPEQVAAIERAGGTVYQPETVWAGNQVEKRTHLFQLEAAEWFFVFDADELVVRVPGDARRRLERTQADVAVYTLGGDRYHRGLFRGLPNLRVEGRHDHYLAEKDGETVHLRGDADRYRLEPFLSLTDLRVQHRRREKERLQTSAVYDRLVYGLENPEKEA